jgi:predicted metalloprotease with PDZ domain
MPWRETPRYAYRVTLPAAGSWLLHVEATLERAPSAQLTTVDADGAVRDVAIVDAGSWRSLPWTSGAWIASACQGRCKVRYDVDLDALATLCRGFDCARRVDGAILAPSSVWMLRPASNADAVITVTTGGDRGRFATGLRRGEQGEYVLRARELGESSYSAFGDLREHFLSMQGATIEVALAGFPLAMGDQATLDWIEGGASCVARFFGRFPVDVTVFVVPVKGADEVVFGRVMSLSGASVVLLFGTETNPASAHGDWVVVHELFHLGTPSFVGEGHWLEEGLATYYEPVLRARAGWMREADLWGHFVKEMPRGLRRPGEPSNLEERDDIDSIYWGGALFALLADMRILQVTADARSLDDVLRAALASQGDATHSARVADFVRLGDHIAGRGVLSELFDRFVVGGQEVDLAALWGSLGVVEEASGAVSLREDAPMSAVRRAISSGIGSGY